MKALVVYESMFGNTEEVARAITTGLSRHLDVELVQVTHAPGVTTDLLDLIVVGGPTHAFSMTRPSTRDDAFTKGATQGSRSVGVREWLANLHKGPHSELVATFDTRVSTVRHLPGSAAKGAAKVLRSLGYTSIDRDSFFVHDIGGPLLPGELERAEAWGEKLGSRAAALASGRAPS